MPATCPHPDLRIVAIGGASLSRRQSWRIDRHIVSMAGRKRPNVLFVPTASGDSPRYIEAFIGLYERKLGCSVTCMILKRERPSVSGLRESIRKADIVYAGGGNTLMMMKAWRRVGVDHMLVQAAKRGAVMCGVSAGAICWFDCGHSDSRKFSGRTDWDYIRVRGLGLLPGMFCPHYHAESREADLARTVARHGMLSIACDNDTALAVTGCQYQVLAASPKASAYVVLRQGGGVRRSALPMDGMLRPYGSLTGTG